MLYDETAEKLLLQPWPVTLQVTADPAAVFFQFNIFFLVWLPYNVLLISAVQHGKSVIHIHISILFWISFPLRSPQTLRRVPGPKQYVLIAYLLYVYWCIYVGREAQ